MTQKDLIFHKMHGLKNDFMILTNWENQNLNPISKEKIMNFSDRKSGIGFDQLILLIKNHNFENKNEYDFEMKIFNPDSSEAEVCGNATRCCGFLIYQRFGMKNIKIKSGEQILLVNFENQENISVKFKKTPDYFIPNDFKKSELISVKDEKNFTINFNFNDLNLNGFYVNIGNPHIVFFLDKIISEELIINISNFIKSFFLKGINIGFCHKINSYEAYLKVFERGAGLTFSCGSGACAAFLCGINNSIFEDRATFYFSENKNYSLEISKNLLDTGFVMRGSAEYVFNGKIS